MKKYIVIMLLLASNAGAETIINNFNSNNYYNYDGIAAAIAMSSHHFDDINKAQVSVSMGVLEQTSAYSVAFAKKHKDVLTSISVAIEEEETLAFSMAVKWNLD